MVQIVKAVIMSAVMGAESLRQIDQGLRLGWMGGRVRGKKGCRISDTTLTRVCGLIPVSAVEKLCDRIHTRIRSKGELGVKLGTRRWKVGVIDGTTLGKHPSSVVMEVGEVGACLGIKPFFKRGKELPVSLEMMKELAGSRLDLMLGDGLYACEKFWQECEDSKMAGIVKTSEETLTIIQDANGIFDAQQLLEGVEFVEGTDANRNCSWRVWGANDLVWSETHWRLKVVRVEETFFKGKWTGQTHRFWVLSQEQTLSAIHLRELAHSRWFIENEAFKAFNEQVHSKHLYSHNSQTALVISWLQIIGAMLLADFHCFLSSLKESLDWLWDHGSLAMRSLRKCFWSSLNLVKADTS